MAKTFNLATFTAFKNEDEAIALLEKLRWPNGAACPHCGGADPYKLTAKTTSKKPGRKGLWKCRACRKQFTVKVGTIFEQSHIPASKWLMALHLQCSSKKGMSAHQFHRMLGVTYRAAWFMAHRLRHAMSDTTLFPFPMSGVVEADETYIGGKRRQGSRKDGRTLLTGRPGPSDAIKTPVMALVERKGRAIAFPVERVDGKTLQDAIRKHVRARATHMMTDDLKSYHGLSMGFAGHDTIKHSTGEYVRENVHTNTVESFFALLKRGIIGTFHHVSKGHLHRYCDEFAFRYTNRVALGVTDEDRTKLLVLAAEGKRLTYRQPSGTRAA
ncbi:MAG TPA: IS1595 family transposase [Vicinamibacterales bacterium]|nr:IS1595 family transposase [Vicinamibacterales bacterium]